MKRKIAKSIIITLIVYIGISIAAINNYTALAIDKSENTNKAISAAQLEKLKLEINELKNKSSNKDIAVAQLTKLKLEIEELKNKSSVINMFPQYIPLLTTVIAVGALCFTIFQFFAAQNIDCEAKEQEKRLKDESQIRNNIEQLLSLDSEK